MIDLFASFHNKKMDSFCTWDHHPQALAVDVFSMSCNQMFAYAFPPICLIPKILQHMRLGQCQVILIAPQLSRRHWYPYLLEMCIANPIKLPSKAVLLLWIFCVFVLSCVCYVLCASVYMCFVVTCWERADLLALVCGVFCEFVTFPLVSWVRCGT